MKYKLAAMKKKLLLLGITSIISIALFSQVYQLPNGGFEIWDGNGSNDEPTNWNGFPSAACDLSFPASLGCGTATATRHEKSTDKRPGSLGTYSCKLFATSALGIIANGTITTGQIRIGSTTATSNQNYDITRTDNANFKQAINAKPDSIRFWAKFVCPSTTQTAKLSAVIHDNYAYRDPDGSDSNAESHCVAKATKFFNRGAQGWVYYSVPFDYNHPTSNISYILITFSTNSESGVGSTSDFLWVDDVELVYNTKLSDLKVNGITVQNFNPLVHDYYLDVDCGTSPIVSATTQSANAGLSVTQATGGSPALIVVTSGNSTDTYHVYFTYAHIEYISDEICLGEPYNENGFSLPVQTTAGLFNHQAIVYESATCDSITNLSLTVHEAYTNETVNVMICGDGEYNFNGNILTQAGYYETTLSSFYGCDSIVSLNLTVGSYYQTEIFASICEGEFYNENGFNTDIAGLNTMTYTAQNGCDSLVILDLIINPVFSTLLNDSTSVGIAYTLNGFDINAVETPGIFSFSLELSSIYGCDSIVYLSLLVNDIPEDTTTIPLPDGNFNFSIYPSPANEEFIIKADSEVTYEVSYIVYDLFGKRILVGNIFNEVTFIDISSFASGIYFVKIIYSDTKNIVLKLMVNK